MPTIFCITPHLEPLHQIPCESYVELEDGSRVLFLGIEHDSPGALPNARIKNQTGITQDCSVESKARYICSIVEYEAFAHV